MLLAMLHLPIASRIGLEMNPSETNLPLRVVIAYGDLAAGKRAMGLIANLEYTVGCDFQLHVQPWSFDLLADSNWREVALVEVINSDILIITTSSSNAIPLDVREWVGSALSRKGGTHAAVVALVGTEEDRGGPDSTLYRYIQTVARQAGLDFFAPTAKPEPYWAHDVTQDPAERVASVSDWLLPRRVSDVNL